jgi:putative copper export protein/methionine-rich copper-binding protein CopC
VLRPIGRLWAGRRLGRVGLAAVLAGLWLVAAGAPAGAHALLRESDPAAGSSLDRAPRRVVLTFTERPEQGLSSISVLDTGGRPVQRGESAPVEGAPLQLAVNLGDLADGTYTVSWRVVSMDDGHVTAGSFAFGVGVPAPSVTPQAQAAPQGTASSPSVPATVARLGLYAGLILLVGVAVTGLAVFDRVLPLGARPLLVAAAALTLAGGAARFLAEQARIDAPLGTLLASSTGQGLLRLAAGVAATAVATWFLATSPGRPAPGRPAPPDPGHPAHPDPGHPTPPDPGDPAPMTPPDPGRPALMAASDPGHPAVSDPGHPAVSDPGHPAASDPGHPAVSDPGHPASPDAAGPGRVEPALAPGSAPTAESALAVAGPPEGEPSRRQDGVPADVHSPPEPPVREPGGAVDRWRLVLVGVAAGVTMLLHVLVGHAAGPSPLRSVNLLVQWLHLLAVGAWIGGLVWLLAGLRGRERPEQLSAAVRFSKLAAPVLGLVAVTGLSRALHLAGGWRGLLDSSYGRFLDLKVALFVGLVLLGALNRYRVLPALVRGVRRLDSLRRNVRGEIALAACILVVTAVFSQLPPGKFVVEQAAAKPPAPPSVRVEGSDFATSVRIALTVSPGTPGPNAFTAEVTDYDSGEDWPATRVALRFTPRGRPEIGTSTLDLTRAGDGSWRGQGSQLSIAGAWVVVGLVEGSGPAVTVPMELEARAAPQPVKVSEVPGQPTLYTITLAAGGTLQCYIDPGRTGPNTVHFTFFRPGGDEQPTTRARARMAGTSGGSAALTLIRLGPGHFAANVDLQPGRVSFAIDATGGRTQRGGRFEQVIE